MRIDPDVSDVGRAPVEITVSDAGAGLKSLSITLGETGIAVERFAVPVGEKKVSVSLATVAGVKEGKATLRIAPRKVTMGDSIELRVTLRPKGRQPQVLAIDYAVHHVKANGGTSAKVFKGWTVELAGAPRKLVKRHAVKPITTRRYFAGRHMVDLIVNGQVQARAAFELLM